MDLQTYVLVLRKNLAWIIACAIAGIGLGYLAYAVTPPLYASVTQFYVSTPLPDGANAQSAGQFAQARVSSYIRLLNSEELARRIIAKTGVNLKPTDVAARIDASTDTNTVLVTATVTDPDPQVSLKIATGLAATFGPMVDELDNQGRNTAVVVINIVSGPTLLPGPVSPSLRTNLLIGLGAGLGLCLIAIFLRELLDVSIRSAAEAQHSTQAPVLGTIPFDTSARKEPLLVGEGAMSIRGEAFRKLRTNLQFVDATGPAQVIMVTSSLPQEGKTSVSANLALSLAETEERVLVIDADLRKPQISNAFDIESFPGLSNLLAGQVEPEDAIQQWGDEGLFILPSGSIPPNPAELLGSDRMKELIGALRKDYTHIIIDTPPVSPVTDAAVASGLVDATLVVVRFGKTPRSTVAHATAALRAVRAPIVGTVLNMTKVGKQSDSYYGHAKYYRYETAAPKAPFWRSWGQRTQRPTPPRPSVAIRGNASQTPVSPVDHAAEQARTRTPETRRTHRQAPSFSN